MIKAIIVALILCLIEILVIVIASPMAKSSVVLRFLPEDVRKAAFYMYEHGGIDLVCVDYIQLLESNKKRNNRQEEVSDISRGMKRLAQELKIPVIALSQRTGAAFTTFNV